MNELASKECVPCKGGVPPLKGDDLQGLLSQLGNEWQVIDEHHLEKDYKFPNFREALNFTNRVGELAEEQGHHPVVTLMWGKVKISLSTHAVGGLSENDFIMARVIDSVCDADA